jgi:hypothetical protein
VTEWKRDNQWRLYLLVPGYWAVVDLDSFWWVGRDERKWPYGREFTGGRAGDTQAAQAAAIEAIHCDMALEPEY